jgi:hypothetical protein
VLAAQHYLLRLPVPPPCRFDVVAIDGDRIEWLPAPSLDRDPPGTDARTPWPGLRPPQGEGAAAPGGCSVMH